jgi:protein involved in polysaccharide export with SLBB domain
MFKVIVLLFVFIFSNHGSSQEFNEAYLDSLPADIRKDVEDRLGTEIEEEKSVYRFSEITSDIRRPIVEEDIFGSAFFSSMQSSFMPVNTPNLDDSYILDYGDELSIQLTGQFDIIDSYLIGRDGSIRLPEIGQINLAGLSLGEASRLIKKIVKQTYISTDAYVVLKNIRDVSVLLAGDVFNPGVYTLNGNSNMLHALHVAGGINIYGSYRNIQLIRNDKVLEVLDIYDILIKGKLGIKNRLRSGDIIFVGPRENVVTLEGAFKRPTKYELLDGQNISDAIKYSNGIDIDADYSNIFLHRILDDEIKSIPIANISQFNKIPAIDKDRIFIRKNSFRSILISGAVTRPGRYKMVEGEDILDLIEHAGGYSKNAFPEGAVYINLKSREINTMARDKLYDDFINGLIEVIQKSAGQADFASLSLLAKDIKDVTPSGRVVVDLVNYSQPVLVQDGDELYIPERTNTVYIYGEVNSEGALEYSRGADLDYYLDNASGVKDTANMNSIYIQFPNGKTSKFSKKRNIFANQPNNKINIVPGSVIYVPRKIDDTISSSLAAQAYASILGNISLTLASIKSIN